MAVIEVVFHNQKTKEDLPLLFQIYDIPPAQRWLTYLEIALQEHSPIEHHRLLDRKVHGRFVGFPETDRTPEQVSQLINECIDLINEHRPNTIDVKAKNIMDQDDLNQLHKYFEIYRGPVLQPHELYEKGPQEIKKALEDFNIYIHEYEDLLRVNRLVNDGKSARVDVVFLGKRTRYELHADDFKYFELYPDFGHLSAHYCEVGKQLLDVFRDNDEIVGEENIRPFKYMSADFDIFFGRTLNPEAIYYSELDFKEWLLDEGHSPWDKSLSMGHLIIGKMIRDSRFRNLNQEQFIERFKDFWDVKEILVYR